MKKFAVIGSPVSHSLSPQIHSTFAEQNNLQISYEAIEVKEKDFLTKVDNLFNEGYIGLNITLPLKEAAFKYAKVTSERALLAESVNTLCVKGESIYGDTTDGAGLLKDFDEKNITVKDSKVVLIGAGGSAKAILPSLISAKPRSIYLINRTYEKAVILEKKYKPIYPNIEAFEVDNELNVDADLIINSSSAGTIKKKLVMPKNLFGSESKAKVYDLSYSKKETAFNLYAQKCGVNEIYDGLGMLVHQAALSFEIWNNLRPNTLQIEQNLRA